MRTRTATKRKVASSKTRKFYCPKESLSKMVLYFKSTDKTPLTRYSPLAKDKKGKFEGLKALVKLANSPEYVDQWRTMLIYDNHTGLLAEKWVNGKQIIL